MVKLKLNGYLCRDFEGIIALTDKRCDDFNKNCWESKSIIKSIEEFAEENGFYRETEYNLGGKLSYIDNCNNLQWELESHIGQYVHIIIEC